ncbi:unnamed protein product [Ectocarpus sp. CCAP 1310/34]|nr:unnamed protein product [Ectocarpus sp. CCAP 1310/34]
MVKLKALGSACVALVSGVQAFVPPSPPAASSPPPPATGGGETVSCSAATASRLDFLRGAGAAAAAAAAGFALLPAAGNAQTFTDDALGFNFDVPDGWERNDAEISGRRKIVVYTSPTTPGANAFVAYTPARGDFTSLGSFGTLDEVSKTVLPQATDVSSRMVESYTYKNSYVYDYIVDQEGRPEKHIKTMWVLFPEQGQLATITAQCNESDYAQVGKTIDSLIASVTKKK